MAIAGRNKLLLTGTIAGGEQWSVGFTYGAATIGEMIVTQEDLNAWAQAASSLINDSALSIWRNALSTAGAFGYAIAQFYDADNVLTLQSVPQAIGVTGLGTPSKPPQTAIVVSLLTGRPGASYRGRVYIPAMGGGMDNTLKVDTPTDTQDLADQTAEFLSDMANEAAGLGANIAPGVYSPTKDVVTPVTGVRVGDVFDTQRRRRNQLTEFYAIADLP